MSVTRFLLLSTMLMLLQACSTELFDQNYSPYPGEFDEGNGIVTIFREAHFVGGRVFAFIKVGERPFGDIGNGSGVRIGLPPGHSVISVHSALSSENLAIPIDIEPGKQYFVELAAQAQPMYTVGAVPYLLSTLKSGVHQYCGAGWCAAIEDREIAIPKVDKINFRERVTKSSF